MEPFALFQLLQSLFNASPSQEPTPPVSNETEEPPSAAPTQPTFSSSQEAALRFLSEHENRAKRTKKP